MRGFLILFIFIFGFKIFGQGEPKYQEKHLQIVLRNIGHQLLQKDKDFKSNVLPVQHIKNNLYQIGFQNHLSFSHDTLINIIEQNIKTYKLASDYIVTVLNCENKKIAYAYEVSTKTKNIIPCSGRHQAKGCYQIQIEFLHEEKSKKITYLLLLFPITLFLIYLKNNFKAKSKLIQTPDIEQLENIGKIKYSKQNAVLLTENNKIELTDNENKLLHLLCLNKNILVSREFLLKEIWENEGTIVVSRSLDVLVSKLRKKLKYDTSLKILNIHGKGYKLTINLI